MPSEQLHRQIVLIDWQGGQFTAAITEVLRSDASYTFLNVTVRLANEAILGTLCGTFFRNCGHL